MKNIAVIGCGYWGKNLIRCFHSLGVLKGVFDANQDLAHSYSFQYPELNIYAKLEDVLNDDEIEGVVIAVPVEYHYDVALKCLNADKHIFVEKPVTSTVEEAEHLLQLSREKERVFLVGHLLEYHPAVIKLRDLVYHGVIGDVKEIYSHRLNAGKVRQFENVWWSFAPHDILLMLNTVGSQVEKVNCFMADHLHRGVADSTITTFNFKNGIFGHIYVSWTHPFKLQRFVVVGTKGAIEFSDSNKEDKLKLYRNSFDVIDNVMVLNKGDYESIEFEDKEPLLEECKDFIACIKSGNFPRSSGESGLKVVKILHEAMGSSE